MTTEKYERATALLKQIEELMNVRDGFAANVNSTENVVNVMTFPNGCRCVLNVPYQDLRTLLISYIKDALEEYNKEFDRL